MDRDPGDPGVGECVMNSYWRPVNRNHRAGKLDGLTAHRLVARDSKETFPTESTVVSAGTRVSEAAIPRQPFVVPVATSPDF